MLYLESFIHRVHLAEVVSHWIVDQPQPGDVTKLKRIVNFNSYVARIWVDLLAVDVFSRLYGQPPRSFIAKTKGQVKDFLVENPTTITPRVEELFARYRRFPEDFYRDTPFDGRVYSLQHSGRQEFIGSSRIKRFRRIAEKGSRRIVDYLFERIRANADALAEDRAKALGIPKHQLITPEAQQVEEFLHAERRLIKMIRRGTIQHEFPILSIPDVVGIKIIAESDRYERLIQTLEQMPCCTLLEQEHHTGRYNAINLRVAYQVPRDLLLARLPNARQRLLLAYRGFDPDTVLDEYVEFLETGEDHVLLEIIVSSYEEFLESEIGRSMHEERIVEQRSLAGYSGHLATNVFYLMDYVLALCLAPTRQEVTEVPIKLWVKYMPDRMERLHRQIYDLPVDASFDEVSEETTSAARCPPLPFSSHDTTPTPVSSTSSSRGTRSTSEVPAS